MMAALLEWGAEQGASTVWLHVETDNEPALALYAGLGLPDPSLEPVPAGAVGLGGSRAHRSGV